jgi:formamidopyrimidine-DNA glycosylase
MPEGPEIRTDADQLDFFLSHRIMNSVKLLSPAFEKRCKGLAELQTALPLTVDRVRARGKKLFIFFKGQCLPLQPLAEKLTLSLQPPVNSIETKSNLSGGPGERSAPEKWFIVFGYGMTGNISQDKQKHSHLEFGMNQSWIGFNSWFYSDIRRFGIFEASNDPKILEEYFSEIAPPIALGYQDEKYFKFISRSEFEQKIKNISNGFLATKLMDQKSICSGVGNYILSEVFYEARLDPFIKCKEVDDEKMEALWNALHKVMIASYKHRGMSMSDYLNVTGESGTFENILSVYGKAGKFINHYKIYSCKGPHGRTIFFTAENGTETLRKINSSEKSSSEETENED